MWRAQSSLILLPLDSKDREWEVVLGCWRSLRADVAC